SRNLKRPLDLAIDAAHCCGPYAHVVDAVIGIRSDLASREVVGRVGHLADRDRARIAHRDQNPVSIWTDRGDGIRGRLEDLHQIGRWRLVGLLGPNRDRRPEQHTRAQQDATVREEYHDSDRGRTGSISAGELTDSPLYKYWPS